MRRSKFTEAQVVMSLGQAESRHAGCRHLPDAPDDRGDVLPVEETVCDLGLPELRELKRLGDENGRLKRLVADLSLDKAILQETLRKKR
jgi:putative transposase